MAVTKITLSRYLLQRCPYRLWPHLKRMLACPGYFYNLLTGMLAGLLCVVKTCVKPLLAAEKGSQLSCAVS